MKKRRFIGTNVQRGSIDGNLVTYTYYFNTMVFRLYVNHRVAQLTNVKSKWEYSKQECMTYDRYDFVVSTRDYQTLDDVLTSFVDNIISIDKFINLDYDKSERVSMELMCIMG